MPHKLTIALIALASFCALLTDIASADTVSSTVPESGFSGFTGGVTTFATFNNFGTPPFLSSINSITLTLTVSDGDTASGNFDFNNISLALSGLNTGVLLNGFNNGQTNTLTFGPTSIANATGILAALNTGTLIGQWVDSNPGDNSVTFPSNFNATLTINGAPIPEPASMLLWGALSGVALVGSRLRRRHTRAA
jgi:hypothetical protein